MIEPMVIQSSKLRVASIHIMGVGLALIWPLLYIFAIHPADHMGIFFKSIFALCALVNGVFTVSEGRKVWRVFNTPGDW